MVLRCTVPGNKRSVKEWEIFFFFYIFCDHFCLQSKHCNTTGWGLCNKLLVQTTNFTFIELKKDFFVKKWRGGLQTYESMMISKKGGGGIVFHWIALWDQRFQYVSSSNVRRLMYMSTSFINKHWIRLGAGPCLVFAESGSGDSILRKLRFLSHIFL